VDDYVVCRPYFDVSRLGVALHMAEQRMRAHMESGSLERRLEEAAGGFDSLRQLRPESLRRMDEARDTGEAGYLRILSDVNHEFHDLSRSLSSKLRDAAAAEHLTEELHRFNQQQVKPRFAQQRNELAMPYEALVGEICGKVDSLAETAERIAPPRRRTVLVVDDDPVMRSLLCELLEDEKYLVYEAGDAAAAMLMLGRVHPDAILLDYMMPNKNGIALLQEMHAIADLKDVPVIMLTAHSDRHVVQASLEAGARDFLVKPIDPSNLSRKLKKCFS
jgi:CheY-like chemotaxis protein